VLRLIAPSKFVSASEASVLRLRARGREALAFAKQASLIHHDFGARLPQAAAGDHVVVLLHGLFATAGVLRPLKQRIEQETGAHTASFSYVPGPGVNRIAVGLADLIEQLPRGARVHLVGHSLGGVVARYFVQELGGDPRVQHTVSLGSPFGGTTTARLMPARAGRDICPGSELLQRLCSTAGGHPVPHLSISGADDTLVSAGTQLPGSEHVELADCGHNGLLFDPRAAALVVGRIRSVMAQQAGQALTEPAA